MDPTTLVSRERAERAGELLRQFSTEGLTATGALWAQMDGDGQPYLYIVTPNVQSEGSIRAYQRLGRLLRAFQPGVKDPYRRLDPYEIKFVGPSEDLGRAMAQWYQQYPDDAPHVHSGPMAGPSSVYLDLAYIYPASLFAAPAAPPA